METYYGYVESVHDALLIFEACRLGLLHRVQRRLSEKERQRIRSGSVFVWEEEESGMRRWTDGRTWSPSRVHGSFLTYRELDNKRKSGKLSDTPSPTLSCNEPDFDTRSHNSHHSDDFQYKNNGMIKQSLSVTTANNRKLHLICYFNKEHVFTGNLKLPSQDASLSHIVVPKGVYPDMSNELYSSNHVESRIHKHREENMKADRFTPYGRVPNSFSNHATIVYDRHRLPSPASSEASHREIELAPLSSITCAPMYNLPPPSMPYQDISLDRIPFNEDRRQLAMLTTGLCL
ncbi:Gluconate transport-inducing protein [Basidiobolus ranarum]|uniref:Gluconate transport-inducing protein n=1 Tax=Basidiobolus ranarum TaxID=34480 RepID=A0ABR2W7B1_9FUNG